MSAETLHLCGFASTQEEKLTQRREDAKLEEGSPAETLRLCGFASNQKEPVVTASCPECAADVTLAADTLASEIVACPDCGAELEVVSLDPPTLALAPEVEEDWGE